MGNHHTRRRNPAALAWRTLAALFFAFALAACGGDSDGDPSSTTPTGDSGQSHDDATDDLVSGDSDTDDTPTDGDADGTPTDGDADGTPTDGDADGTPTDSDADGTPTDSDADGTPTDSDADGTPTDSDADGDTDLDLYEVPDRRATLSASPDLVHLLALGARQELAVHVRTALDAAASVETFTLTSADDAIARIEDGGIEAVSSGRTAITVTADVEGHGTLTTTVDVLVGDDLIALPGLTVGLYSVNTELFTRTETSLESSMNPSGMKIVDGRGYAVFSGDSFGGTIGSSLLIFDPNTLTTIAWLEDVAPAGAQDVAVRSVSEIWLTGPEDDVWSVDIDAASAGRLGVLEDERLDDLAISLGAGSGAAVWGPWLIVGNSTLDSFVAQTPATLFFIDIAGEEPELFDGFPGGSEEDPAPYLAVPEACVNISALEVRGRHALVSCTGNYDDIPGAVTLLDLRSFTFEQTVSLPVGSLNGAAWDPFSGTVVVAEGTAQPRLAVIDLVSGDVVRAGDSALALVGETTDAWNAAKVITGDDGTFWAITFGTDEIFEVSLDMLLDLETPSVPALTTLSPGAAALGGQFLARRVPWRAPLALDNETVRVFHPNVGTGYADPRNLFGPPTGGGAFAPQSSPEHLMSVPAGEAVTLELHGVVLVDGPGDDLVIFENVLFLGGDPMVRAVDPARVEFSADGETWVPYPTEEDDAHPFGEHAGGFATDVRRFVEGFLGIEAVWANHEENAISPGNPAAGGDRFDLSRVGMPEARAIRIVADHEGGSRPDIDSVVLIHWQHD